MEEDILGELHDLSNHVLFVNERAIGKIACLTVDNDRLRKQVAELVEVLREGVRSLTDDQPAIVDVVWCATQPCETLHDYFVAAIAKATGGE